MGGTTHIVAVRRQMFNDDDDSHFLDGSESV